MRLGVESYTLMNEFKEDFFGTLKKVSDMGFKSIEWLTFVTPEDPGIGKGYSPKEAVKIFDDYGMKLTGCIMSMINSKERLFDMEWMQKVIDWFGEAGCYSIGLSSDRFINEEFLKRRMDCYNELGKRCGQYGMVWTYHNHFHEVQKVGDKTVLQLMVELTDPNTVGFDWDIYWGVRGLVDPVANIKNLGKKIKCFHCKDFPFSRLDHINIAQNLPDELLSWDNREKFSAYRMTFPEDFIECGQGIIKWQDVVNAANEFEIPYMFIEQDYTTYPDKFISTEVSKDYLIKLKGVTF